MEMTWPTCRLVFRHSVQVRSGYLSGGRGRRRAGEVSPFDDGQPVLQVVHDLLPHGRATILVPHGAHQMVQRPVEALSPRGVSMSSSEVFGDSASTSCW